MNTNTITNNIIIDNINSTLFKSFKDTYINNKDKIISLYSIYKYYFDKTNNHYFIYIGINPTNNYHIFNYLNIDTRHIEFNQAKTIELIDNNNIVTEFFSSINDTDYPYESILLKHSYINNNDLNKIVNMLQKYYS